MKTLKTSLALALAALAATPLAQAQSGETIAVFTKNQTNPFFQAVRLGADSAAKQLNARVTHYVPTKPDSIPEQMSQVEDVIVKKPARSGTGPRIGRSSGVIVGRPPRSSRTGAFCRAGNCARTESIRSRSTLISSGRSAI